MNPLVVGVDFGTSGVRAVVLDAVSGERQAAASSGFPQWNQGKYCDAPTNVFRQHPAELAEAFNDAVSSALARLNRPDRSRILALSVDTTGSSPTAIGADGLPLAFSPEYETDPDAMLILWKDHSAVTEAQEISAELGESYPSEWFWAKILRVARKNPRVAAGAATWAEHADWFPAYLCDNPRFETWKRCRSGAAHKALWSADGDGYPPRRFFERIDGYLAKVVDTLGNRSWCSDEIFGYLSEKLAGLTGLPAGIAVGVGSFDAHSAALAGGARPGTLVKIIGTSSSDMAVSDLPISRGFPGVESVADGSIIPERITIESGQAAYGDLAAWLVSILSFRQPREGNGSSQSDVYTALESAAKILPMEPIPLALDWFNGRRSPDGDLTLRGAISGLSLGTSAPALYFSVLEAAAFGTRAVHEHLMDIGVSIDEVVVLGGVADRSPLAMRILADVLNRPLSIRESSDASAHGAAIYAAVVGGAYSSVSRAQQVMQLAERERVEPGPDRVAGHAERYKKYQALAQFQSSVPEK